MPLPEQNVAWPPAEWQEAFGQYAVNDAWYSGDVDALLRIYSTRGANAGGFARGDSDAFHYNKGNGNAGVWRRLVDGIRTWFTGSSKTEGESRTRLHSPLAGNLATLSADVLMSEPPTVRISVDGVPIDGGRDADGKRQAHPAQERLDRLVQSPATHRTLIQAAEYAAGLSGVALTVNWDRDNTDQPWLGVVACDAVVPEWAGDRLVAVNLWTTYPTTTALGVLDAVFYHVERHEAGYIRHALYKGTESTIGEIVRIDSIQQTEHIAGIAGAGLEGNVVVLPTGVEGLTAAYWRNLPTRRFRRNGTLSRIGRSDFEGVEHYLDQVDMVWSSWMRDIKIARARLIVPESFLDSQTPGGGPVFDDDREIMTALNYVSLSDNETIQAHQFAIRAAEHADTILALTKEVLQHAGYSLASYGEYGDVQKTATEVNDRTTATERTRDKKALYLIDALVPILETMLEIDAVHYPNGVALPANAELVVEFAEQSQVDPEKEARVFEYLRRAMAASTETMVRAQHPEWDDVEVREEVAAIVRENQLGPEVDPVLEGRTNPDGTRANASGEIPPDEDELEEEAAA